MAAPARRQNRKAAHNAGVLAREITVTYPFHPLAKQSFVAFSEHEHHGITHLLIRSPDGTTHLFPGRMTTGRRVDCASMLAPRKYLSVTSIGLAT